MGPEVRDVEVARAIRATAVGPLVWPGKVPTVVSSVQCPAGSRYLHPVVPVRHIEAPVPSTAKPGGSLTGREGSEESISVQFPSASRFCMRPLAIVVAAHVADVRHVEGARAASNARLHGLTLL